jgi:elongation factor Ts
MAISSELVKELRNMTGAGILDCKKALEETDGDLGKAVEVLQKRNQAVAVKKMNREAKDGKVAAWVSPDGRLGVLAEVNSETDFVARADDFVAFVGQVCEHVAKAAPASVDAAYEQSFVAEPTKTLKQAMTDVVGRVGENLRVRRFERYETAGKIATYIHGGGRIGVMVEVTADKPEAVGTEDFASLCKEAYLQVAAMSPICVTRADLPADVVAKQKEIAMAQLGDISKKPPQIQEKILEGKLGKWYSEACLLEQTYIRDDAKKFQDVVAETSKKLGATVTVKRFARYGLGEGL